MRPTPQWPNWAVAVVLLGLLGLGGLASIAVAIAAAAAGADGLTPAVVLALVIVNLGVVVVVLRRVAQRAEIDLRPVDVGLRRVAPRMLLVAIGFGALAVLAAAGLVLALGGSDDPHPKELGPETAAIVLDLATAVSVLARAVLVAIAMELALRGFLLVALLTRLNRPTAIAIVAVIGAGTVSLSLAPAALLVGAALCLIFLETGSILPTVAVNAAAQGLALGASFDWNAAESVALALAAGGLALLLVLGPTRSWDPGPARS